MFIEEKIQELGILPALPNQFTITNYSNRALVLEGKINLISLTSTQIQLSLSSHNIKVMGADLILKNLTPTTLTIIGNIQSVE